MIIWLAAFYCLLSTTLISWEPLFYAMQSLQHKIMRVLVVLENVRFVDGLISGCRCRATRRHPDASVSKMWRYFRVFKVDLSLINHVRMIWCSYKNSQLNFRSEQRERTIQGKHGNSRFKRNRKNKTHPQHTYYTHNSTLLWRVHVQPGLKSNHSGSSWWGYSPYKQAFFHYVFTAVKKYLLLSCGPRKHPRGLCSIEQLLSTDHERRFQWFGMNTSLHNTKGWTGREVGGSRTVGVNSVGRAGSSYHTATMAASRNILLVHYR